MDIKAPGVFIEPIHIEPVNVHWMKNKYRDCQDVFPDWYSARENLNEFCNGTQPWEVLSNEDDPTQLNIGLRFPLKFDVTAYIPCMVPMIRTFPEIHQDQIQKICIELMADYLPDLNKFIMEIVTDEIRHYILSDINNKGQQIISEGGRIWKDEMLFRLGVRWL